MGKQIWYLRNAQSVPSCGKNTPLPNDGPPKTLEEVIKTGPAVGTKKVSLES
jgi:hypothetical protein